MTRFALFAMCAVLAACAGPASRAPAPAPIEDRLRVEDTDIETDVETPHEPAKEPPSAQQLALAEDPYSAAPPSSAAVQTLLAAAMQAATRDDWDRAQAALERAIKLAPQDTSLWTQLAYTHLRDGDLDQARELAQRALSLKSTHTSDTAGVWRLIAEIETARGNAAEAEYALREASRLAP